VFSFVIKRHKIVSYFSTSSYYLGCAFFVYISYVQHPYDNNLGWGGKTKPGRCCQLNSGLIIKYETLVWSSPFTTSENPALKFSYGFLLTRYFVNVCFSSTKWTRSTFKRPQMR